MWCKIDQLQRENAVKVREYLAPRLYLHLYLIIPAALLNIILPFRREDDGIYIAGW